MEGLFTVSTLNPKKKLRYVRDSHLKAIAIFLSTHLQWSQADISRKLHIATSTLSDLLRRDVSTALVNHQGSNLSYQHLHTLTSEHCDFLSYLLDEHDSRLHLYELQRLLYTEASVSVSIRNIHDTLSNRMNYSYKKASRIKGLATDEENDDYWFALRRLTVNQLVFFDEMTCNRSHHERKFARSRRGTAAPHNGFFTNRSNRIISLVAMAHDGIVAEYSQVGGNISAQTVLEFFNDDLLPHTTPFPGPRSVLILDNAKVHHVEELQLLCDEAGVLLLFLPPYSPFWNPTELVFSMVKTFLRTWGAEFHKEFPSSDEFDWQFLQLAYDFVSPQNCANFVRHCGYV